MGALLVVEIVQGEFGGVEDAFDIHVYDLEIGFEWVVTFIWVMPSCQCLDVVMIG